MLISTEASLSYNFGNTSRKGAKTRSFEAEDNISYRLSSLFFSDLRGLSAFAGDIPTGFFLILRTLRSLRSILRARLGEARKEPKRVLSLNGGARAGIETVIMLPVIHFCF
jgi:hypothetical protein